MYFLILLQQQQQQQQQQQHFWKVLIMILQRFKYHTKFSAEIFIEGLGIAIYHPTIDIWRESVELFSVS